MDYSTGLAVGMAVADNHNSGGEVDPMIFVSIWIVVSLITFPFFVRYYYLRLIKKKNLYSIDDFTDYLSMIFVLIQLFVVFISLIVLVYNLIK